MVSVLESGSSGPGSSPGPRCVFGQDTLLSCCLSPPRCINGYRRIYCWGYPALDWRPIQEEVEVEVPLKVTLVRDIVFANLYRKS